MWRQNFLEHYFNSIKMVNNLKYSFNNIYFLISNEADFQNSSIRHKLFNVTSQMRLCNVTSQLSRKRCILQSLSLLEYTTLTILFEGRVSAKLNEHINWGVSYLDCVIINKATVTVTKVEPTYVQQYSPVSHITDDKVFLSNIMFVFLWN